MEREYGGEGSAGLIREVGALARFSVVFIAISLCSR
jgi:hypothetical protein